MIITRKIRLQLQLQKFVFIILLLLAVGMLGWLSQQNSVQFDWTSNKRNTLSQASIDLLNTLMEPVTVNVYVQDDETVRAAVEEILNRYKRVKPDFNYRLINPDIDFETAQLDNIKRYGQIVIKYKNSKEIITSLGEQKISNALLRLSRAGQHKLVFLQGHGERSPVDDSNTSYSKLAAQLTEKGFKVETHHLLRSEIPTDTTVLVIAAPDKTLLEGELEHIKTYINNGGNVFWMMEPGEMQGMGGIAELLGIRFHDGIVVDDNANLRNTLRIAHPAMIPVLDYHQHAITSKLAYNTLFPIARGIKQTDDNWNSTVIAQSLARSWSEASELGGETAFNEDEGDINGPITLILALERVITAEQHANKATQRVVVAGDSDFIANSYIGAGANLSLGVNILSWLAGDDDLITVEIKNAPDLQLQLDDTEILLIGVGFFIVLPLGLLTTGFVIWFKRRKR